MSQRRRSRFLKKVGTPACCPGASFRSLGLRDSLLSEKDMDGTLPRDLDRQAQAVHLKHQTALALSNSSHAHRQTLAQFRRELSHGLDRVDARGNSRLHLTIHAWSRERGDPLLEDTALVLCVAGCGLDVVNDELLTPLHVAIKRGACIVVCMLLHLGADYTAVNAQKYHPLLLAAEIRAAKGCEGGQLQRLLSRSFSTRFG